MIFPLEVQGHAYPVMPVIYEQLMLQYTLSFLNCIASLIFSLNNFLWSYYSHEIKRCLLLGRKVMTNVDSILRSRDITLPTNVRLVKAMVFPVVMYGCESWTIKQAEH